MSNYGGGMLCPKCQAGTKVLETRDGTTRRRECENGHRFWTEETLVRFVENASQERRGSRHVPPRDAAANLDAGMKRFFDYVA